MRFKEIERVVYKHNILSEVLFQARFPEILKISQDIPIDFQDLVRKEGYLELVSDIPIFSSNTPKELEEIASTTKIFHFHSELKDWKVSIAKDFVALTFNGHYRNYTEFRKRLEIVLQIFTEIYDPFYFTRIGLRHKNIANKTSLPHIIHGVEIFIPEYIFPELSTPIVSDIEALRKISQFNDGEMKANVAHVLSKVSGRFRQKQFANEKSYIIDIDCYSESKTEETENVLTKCDIFKKLNWNIFQWSITDNLRQAMEKSGS